ncbi:S41 family peptidase [Sporosarcina cyprini]|uniref:S41 family peptidase n=1 Tax=Sporosarcina cyprini TaxID=2910523 RepID=UPI001EE0897D|nr:S41 family peptidase [Sporosarcina cyprini]MCG3086741.1 S41 family peptidase [Sporosarcina cyprini]
MLKIAEEIVHIMHNDYAGCMDKKGWDAPDAFLEKVKQAPNLSSKEFLELVNDYLLDFKDKHLYMIAGGEAVEKPKTRGFSVRRYEDKLYITKVDSDDRLIPGMRLISAGGMSIPELREKHHRLLSENHPERENWAPILLQYEEGIVEDLEGNQQHITFRLFEKKPFVPEYSLRQLEEGPVLLTMTDFANPDAIAKLVEEHKDLLETAEQWIIDVRVNNGGSDASYFPLLPYLVPEEGWEFGDSDETMIFNCTEASCDRVVQDLDNELANVDDEHFRQVLHIIKREWTRNRGKGFVEFDFGGAVEDTFVKGLKNPSKIIVLTDNMCGSAGDSFVEHVKELSKVTVIGRATLGVNDYANLASASWDGYTLMYPTSRLSRIDKGKGMTGVGITPHIHIPWTPDHIAGDPDLEQALAMLKCAVEY